MSDDDGPWPMECLHRDADGTACGLDATSALENGYCPEHESETARCSETIYHGMASMQGAVGHLDGATHPCRNRARWLVMDPSTGMQSWRPLCGTHANAGRWANYPSLEWKEIGR